MARPGRKPAPSPLKVARGTRTDRINPAEPPRLDGEPEQPAFLDAIAREEWARMVANLRRIGILSAAHAPTLALYCQQYSRLVQAEAEIAKAGLITKSERGADVPTAYVRIARDCSLFCARMLAEFGLSPSASSRITGASQAPADSLEEFLKSG